MRQLTIAAIALVCFFGCVKKQEEENSLFHKWQIEGLLESSDSTAINSTSSLFMEFHTDKTVDIQLDINSCGGTFSIDKQEIILGNMACTEACCDTDFALKFISLLSKVNSYYFVSGKLNLAGDDNLNIRLIKVD